MEGTMGLLFSCLLIGLPALAALYDLMTDGRV